MHYVRELVYGGMRDTKPLETALNKISPDLVTVILAFLVTPIVLEALDCWLAIGSPVNSSGEPYLNVNGQVPIIVHDDDPRPKHILDNHVCKFLHDNGLGPRYQIQHCEDRRLMTTCWPGWWVVRPVKWIRNEAKRCGSLPLKVEITERHWTVEAMCRTDIFLCHFLSGAHAHLQLVDDLSLAYIPDTFVQAYTVERPPFVFARKEYIRLDHKQLSQSGTETCDRRLAELENIAKMWEETHRLDRVSQLRRNPIRPWLYEKTHRIVHIKLLENATVEDIDALVQCERGHSF